MVFFLMSYDSTCPVWAFAWKAEVFLLLTWRWASLKCLEDDESKGQKIKKKLHGIAYTITTYKISKKFCPVWFQIAHNGNYLPVPLSVSHLCCLTYTFRWKQGWKWTCDYLGEAGIGNPEVKVALWNDMDDVWYQNFNNRFISSDCFCSF